MQRAQMLLKVSRIWSLVHDSNQVPISYQLVSVSKEQGKAVKPTTENQVALAVVWQLVPVDG